ncbi:Regulatory protein recX [Magnetospira sp. QH-2]|nr:Regulatory protein recX [Magnetospira sp. QH-2]
MAAGYDWPMSGQRKIPREATPERLEKAALHYLERYASSIENLRRVLMRRVRTSAHYHGTDLEQGAAAIDAIIEKLVKKGFLNDALYAEGRVAALRRRGTAERMIVLKLKEKGLDNETIRQALDRWAEDQGTEEGEFAAAVNLARRRRLGPWRDPAKRSDTRDKDWAALARAGFSPDLARKVVDAESVEILENGESD